VNTAVGFVGVETEFHSETAKVSSSDGKNDVDNDDDDDSTAAISESSSSSHICTAFGKLTEATVSPPMPDSNGNGKCNGNSNGSNDSILLSVSQQCKEDVNYEEGGPVANAGEDIPALLDGAKEDGFPVMTTKKPCSIPSETAEEEAVVVASTARVDAEGLVPQEKVIDAVLANEPKDASAMTESDVESVRDASGKPENAGAQTSEMVANAETTSSTGNLNIAVGGEPELNDRVDGEEVAVSAAEEKPTLAVDTEPASFHEIKHEFVSNTIVSETPAQSAKYSTDAAENKKSGEEDASLPISTSAGKSEIETPSVTLAQRMKEMFDSSSPDKPSNAFGKNARIPSVPSLPVVSDVKGDEEMTKSPKPVFLANDMKKMFDSSSPDEPSRAFGVGKDIVQKQKHPSNYIAKVQCDSNNVQIEYPNAVPTTKLTSPLSVADQMLSMMWASSSPTKKFPPSSIEKREVDDNGIILKINHTVIDETIMEVEDEDDDEDIEEITVDDENGFYEVIEEVTIEEEDCRDDMSLTINDGFFEGKSRIELSPDFVNTIEKGECDGRSYDETTADDSEYDEKTVDDDDDGVLQEGQGDDNIKAKEQVKEKEDRANIEANDETFITIKKSGNDDADYSDKDIPRHLQPPRNDPKKKLDFKTKRCVDPEQNHKNMIATSSLLPLPAPVNGTQTIQTPTKSQNNHHIDSPKVPKLNPQLSRDQSVTGRLTEKLKMFDSPKAMQPIIFKQSWKMPKALFERSSREEPTKETMKNKGCNPKTPVVFPVVEPRAKEVEPCNTSGYNKEDKALVEEIVSLVKEPGAMQNRHVLAERITSLLAGKSKEEAIHSPPSKLVESSSPKSKHAVEAYKYMNRKKDGFRDPGLKKIRKEVELEKEKPLYVEDPDTIPKRHMKRIVIKERNDEVTKQATMKSAFDKTQRVVDAEEIMARIWPKTPDGGKRKPKASSSSPRSSKSMSFDSPRKTPRKLGDRLKMFETPPSSSMSSPKNASTLEKDSFTEPPKTFARKTISSKVAAENGIANDNTRRSQISKETVMRISSFQRLWRARKSKHDSARTTHRRGATQGGVAFPRGKKATVFMTETTSPASPKGKIFSDPGMSNLTISMLSDPTNVPIASSGSTSEALTDGGCYYSLEDLEQGRFDRSVVDMERWEGFLSDENFYKHFSLKKDDFYQQPKWKREKQKRTIRVAF